MKTFFSFLLSRCAGVLLLMLCLLSPSQGGEIEVEPERSVIVLRFPKEVVREESLSAPRGSAAEKQSLACVEVQGKASCHPEFSWQNGKELLLVPKSDTPAGEPYTVRLKPGTTYADGSPATQETAEVRFYPAEVKALFGVQLPQGCGVVVAAEERSDVVLSAACGLRFALTEQVEHQGLFGDSIREGRTVTAHAEPATLRHGMNPSLMRLLAEHCSFTSLREDTPLPACLLVVPDEPLPEGTRWLLRYATPDEAAAADKPDDRRWHKLCLMQSLRGLRTEMKHESTSAGVTEATLRFSTPLRTAEVEKLFRAMVLRVGSAYALPQDTLSAEAGAATKQKGVLCRSASFGGSKVRISYLGRVETEDAPKVCGERKGDPDYWSYDNKALCSSVRLRIESETPCTVEFVLPAGSVSSLLGVGVEEDIVHRLSHGAAAPRVDTERLSRGTRLVSLPRGGGHRVILSTDACAGLMVDAHYWTPAEVVEHRAQIAELMNMSPPQSSAYDNALEIARCRAGLTEGVDLAKDERASFDRCLRRTMKTGRAVPPFRVQSPKDSGLASADCPLDLDELVGGRAAPGLYLLSLRALPQQAAGEAAASLGLHEAEVEQPRHIWVQVTGLSLLSDDAVIALQHLEDGTLPAQAALYQSDSRRSIPVQNGFADPQKLPEPDEDAWFVAQEGDDVCLAPCSHRRSRESRDETRLRGKMFSDRTHYRPGEEVHLFGMLRDVCGDASRVAREKLYFTVTAPDGRPLTELPADEVRPDAYGCFELSFTLPEEAEDVMGSYQCKLFAKPHTKVAEAEVQCEVFRRDSFEIEFESVLPPLCPQQYSCTVTARDYNGSPLAGAKVELKLTSDLELPGAHHEKTEEGETSRNKVLTATFRTDEQGRASFSCPVSLPTRGDRFTSECGIMAEVAVTNDRGEVKRATAMGRASFTDFRAVLKDYHLVAFCQPDKVGGARNRLLPRTQKLHAVLRGKRDSATPLANGFVRLTSKQGVLWSGDVVIPAHSATGAALPWDEEFRRNLPYDAELELTGTDGAGRSYRSRVPVSRYLTWDEEDVEAELTVEHKEGNVFTVDAAAGGEVCVVMQSRGQLLTVRRCLQAGKQELTLTEAEGMTGRMQVDLLHPVCGANGLYHEMETATTECFRPDGRRALDIALDLPMEAPRPGSDLTLRGRVTRRADGKPADARVLLFAVDKGMLGIGGSKPELPNWEEHFTGSLQALSFPRTLTLPKRYFPSAAPLRLEGLWSGESFRNGKWGRRYASCDMKRIPHEPSWDVWDVLSVLCPFGQQHQQQAPYCTPAPVAPCMGYGAEDGLPPWELGEEPASASPQTAPRLRSDFRPLAVWVATLKTDREGGFETSFTLPDTLTTYTVFCVASDEDGAAFGNRTEELEVSQPVMLTPGTPLFMSVGDRLLLPLTITNGTKQEDTWKVTLSTGAEQSIRLAPKATGTLFFELAPQEEGECVLRWEARAASGADAVEGRFPVRYPAPLLKETHRVVLGTEEGGAAECRPAALLSADLANSARGELVAELSANPLLHLAGCADFVLEYPYGCTEQISSALLPWILHARLAPVCPPLAALSAEDAEKRVEKSIDELLERQRSDGGLAYWPCCGESCFWASAHAALVLTLAKEQGFRVPRRALRRLCDYLRDERKHRSASGDSPLLRYEVARVLDERKVAVDALNAALTETEAQSAARTDGGAWLSAAVREDVRFLIALQGPRAGHHAAFLEWLRSQGRDSRHASTWSSAWTLLALHEYLSSQNGRESVSRVTLADGRELELGQGVTELPLAARGQKLGSVTELIRAAEETTYVTVRAKAQPSHTSYAGCSDKGLKLTRRYEVQGADGQWHPATSFAVGDIVRVTLTCTKAAKEIHYLVLEDYLPSCMEAINPNVPSQAAGIDFAPWSECFDNREYLTDRIRGFCTRWEENKPAAMVYYARVKRAGTAIAAPAQAQLMYEPQTYALTPNTTVTSRK